MTARAWKILIAATVVLAVFGAASYIVFEERNVSIQIRALGGGNEAEVMNAKNALIMAHGRFVTGRLVDALADENDQKRDRAVAVLIEKGSEGVDALVRRLQTPKRPDAKPSVFDLATVYVSSILNSLFGVTPSLGVRDLHRYEQSRVAAARALGRIGDARAAPALIAALQDQEKDVVSAAVRALGDIGDPSALPALTRLAKDAKTSDRYTVTEMIGRFNEDAAPYLVELVLLDDDTVSWRAAGLLGACGKSQSDEIIKLLSSPSKTTRARAVSILGQTGSPEFLPLLNKAISDPDSDVRELAVRYIGLITAATAHPVASEAKPGDAAAETPEGGTAAAAGGAKPEETSKVVSENTDVLMGLLDDKDPGIRLQAILGLGLAKEPRAVGKLIEALGAGERRVREGALRALWLIGDRQAVEPVARVMNTDPDDWVRNVASLCLESFGDPRARRVPFQDIITVAPAEPVVASEWNENVKSAMLDRKAINMAGDYQAESVMETLVWPTEADMKKNGGAPTPEAVASAMKWIRKYVRPEFLPEGLETHLVSMKESSIALDESKAMMMSMPAGYGGTGEYGNKLTCTATIVRFRIGDCVLQIRDTPYTVTVTIADDKTTARAADLARFVPQMARKVLRDTVFEDEKDIYEEFDGTGYGGSVVRDIPLGIPGYVRVDRALDRQLRMSVKYYGAIGLALLRGASNGKFAVFEMQKADLRGMDYFSIKSMQMAPIEEWPTSVK